MAGPSIILKSPRLSRSGTYVMSGSDGGLFVSTDAGRSWDAGWHYAMQMGMVKHLLIPCVEDCEKSNFGAESVGVGRNRQQRFGGGTEEDVVKHALIL